jgi:hypothetical protein
MTQTTISHLEARIIAQKFIDWYFDNGGERPRISIPANSKHDDDLQLMAYIEQQEAKSD